MQEERGYPILSACGLNCGLCPRYYTDGDSRCPGCGGPGFASKRPSCGVISCTRRHGGLDFCFQCDEYPCKKLEGAEAADSFITHRNMRSDFEKAKRMGVEVYLEELEHKMALLDRLLEGYNDGRRKSLFCTAVNLLPLEAVEGTLNTLDGQTGGLSMKERAAAAAKLLQQAADEAGVSLKLRKKGDG